MHKVIYSIVFDFAESYYTNLSGNLSIRVESCQRTFLIFFRSHAHVQMKHFCMHMRVLLSLHLISIYTLFHHIPKVLCGLRFSNCRGHLSAMNSCSRKQFEMIWVCDLVHYFAESGKLVMKGWTWSAAVLM